MEAQITKEEEIIKAIDEVKEAMLENLRAGKREEEAKIAKEQIHYKLIKAKERLNGLERGL